MWARLHEQLKMPESEEVNLAASDRIQRVLAFASEEADGLGHGFITCQHLLYALACDTKGLASVVLEQSGATVEVLHNYLAQTAASHDRTQEGRMDLADEVRDALECAARAAQGWNHRVVDTEHILYGVIVGKTSADDMLKDVGVNPGQVLSSLLSMQESAPPAAIRNDATHAYRFTLESGWLLSYAVDCARKHGATQVSSLHLLIATLQTASRAQEVLTVTLGLEVDALSSKVQTDGPSIHGQRRLSLADDVQRALGYAIGEAWNRGHLAVTPLHLAMGLARAGRSDALDALAELGLSQADLVGALESAMPPSTTH